MHTDDRDVELIINEPEPLGRWRFTRIPGMSCMQSARLFRQFRRNDVIDEDGNLLAGWSERWKGVLPDRAVPFADDIRDQLIEVYGGHSVAFDHTEAILDFFVAH